MNERSFTLNSTMTLGVLLTLCIQTGGGLVWVGATNARLQTIETQLSHSIHANERLAVLEGQMSMIRDSLNRIEKQVTSNAIEAERRP
jgi:hypothetical protein